MYRSRVKNWRDAVHDAAGGVANTRLSTTDDKGPEPLRFRAFCFVVDLACNSRTRPFLGFEAFVQRARPGGLDQINGTSRT